MTSPGSGRRGRIGARARLLGFLQQASLTPHAIDTAIDTKPLVVAEQRSRGYR